MCGARIYDPLDERIGLRYLWPVPIWMGTQMTPLAAMALSCLMAFPHDAHEHAGIIASDAAGNLICTNQTEGEAFRTRFNIEPPQGYTFVAMFHTHLSVQFSEYFSDADVKLADRYKVPSFLLIAGTRFRVYIPGQTRLVPQSHLPPLLLGAKLSLGDIPQ
jgi:hypothetical protein